MPAVGLIARRREAYNLGMNRTPPPLMTARLNVNIDHVATVREARKTIEPSVIEAAVVCEQAGADGITVHIRGDRRHRQDRDIEPLRQVVTTYLKVEMAATGQMVEIGGR